jgi:hypothetical protein
MKIKKMEKEENENKNNNLKEIEKYKQIIINKENEIKRINEEYKNQEQIEKEKLKKREEEFNLFLITHNKMKEDNNLEIENYKKELNILNHKLKDQITLNNVLF